MSQIKKIIILGEDEHAWFAAAVLAFNCPWLSVTVLGENENNSGFYAAATRGNCQDFFCSLGFSWQELLFSSSATYKLANHYVNDDDNRLDFFHSCSTYGADIGLFEFHHVIKALNHDFPSAFFDAYSLEAQAAKHGKFIVNRDSAWGLHYDRIAFSKLLKTYAQQLGVKHIADAITSVDVDSPAKINQIITGNGNTYAADFYIDARSSNSTSSFEMNELQNTPRRSNALSSWCLTAFLDEHQVYRPATEYRRINDQYWIKKIPLQSRTIVELYGAGPLPRQKNYSALFNNLGYLIQESSVKLIILASGRKNVFWNGNCLALGDSAVALGNLAFPALEVTKVQLEKLLKYFPCMEQNDKLIAEYNRITTQAVDNILDYHCLISAILRKGSLDKELNGLYPSLVARINYFMSTGRYEFHENELISKDEWISLLMGFGVPIKERDALIGTSELERLAILLNSMSAEIKKSVAEMPNHLIFLSQFLQSKNKR
ncbi:tryptophan 7-halogenase [Cellvibrio mixtus]|uniref:tryptophan 7-halogenase n=1 Tax=Cellvibrio mixtus TaxID=39650 RepID=UPI000587E30E|nr:tryptophan 7-halogenase [Cellvibrio mixtus]